ncbi:MAG: hypothetical protein ACLS9K_06785 [Lachnospira eligens]
MKNIFKIIRADLRHIKTNVIALCVIIGLTVIPALYSWFNICQTGIHMEGFHKQD